MWSERPTNWLNEKRRIPTAEVGRKPSVVEDITSPTRARRSSSSKKWNVENSWVIMAWTFSFMIIPTVTTAPTKRSILSFIAKLYDPLGWTASVVIAAKILLQELWLLKDDWDASIPQELVQRWLDYVDDLPHLACVLIPRSTD